MHLPTTIVVAYGRPELLRSSLEPLIGLDLVVVDNGRSDETRAVAESCSARYVRPTANLGFAAGVNEGLAHVEHGRDVLLLNPDAVLSRPDLVALQQELHRRPRTAAVAPLLTRPDGAIEPTEWPMPTPLSPWRGLVGREVLRSGRERFLSGAVLLLNGAAIADVGDFDDRFFLYAEETDWQRRALRAGWTLAVEPSAKALHLGGATSTDPTVRDSHFYASAQLFIRKWHGRPGLLLFRLGSVLTAARRLVLAPGAQDRRAAARALRLLVRAPASGGPSHDR